MRRKKGFTLIELLVVVAIIALLIGILLPSLGRARELANRTVCGTRLAGLYKALVVYAAASRDIFPTYIGNGDATITAFTDKGRNDVGNRDADASTDRDTTDTMFTRDDAAAIYGELIGSITAPWWGIVRDGSVGAKNYTCPSNKDTVPDDLTDPDNSAVALTATWDFGIESETFGTETFSSSSTSYSMMSTYTSFGKVQWGADTNADWVFTADDNNIAMSAAGTPHTLYKNQNMTPSADQAKDLENSVDHKGEGQNVLFGDGHTAFEDDPFVGPSSDNIYAVGGHTNAGMDVVAAAPVISGSADHNDLIDPANTGTKKDICLAPVTGGVSGNLLDDAPNVATP